MHVCKKFLFKVGLFSQKLRSDVTWYICL